MADVAEMFGTLQGDLDSMWLLFGAIIVFFMQTGFAMLEVGTISQKNTSNILLKNVLDAALGSLVWWAIGFGIAQGDASGNGGFIGTTSFWLNYEDFYTAYAPSGYWYAMWLFQWAFAATTATIVSGTVAERCSFTAYITYSICLTGIIYPVVVCWGWNVTGWASAWRTDEDLLFGCGLIDFAGSTVVHMTGGVAAFWGAFFLGPRQARGGRNARKMDPLPPNYAPPYGPIFQTLGTLILWMGWYGFNGVSTLYLVNYGLVAAKTMVTTTIAAGTGGVTTLFLGAIVSPRNVDTGGMVLSLGHATNGVLAGLVAITAPCSTCEPYGAFIIGFLASPVYLGAHGLLEMMGIDDVVSAIPVHGFCGLFGTIMAAFFATKDNYGDAYYSSRAEKCAGLLYGGDGSSLLCALVFILADICWTSALSIAVFGTLNILPGNLLRVTAAVEESGMDSSEHGISANGAPANFKVQDST